MKIISWNCAGAFRKKIELFEKFNADIFIIQECENPEYSTKDYKQWADNYLWIGENKNKGIGVFAKNNNKLKPLNWYKDYFQTGFSNSNKSLTWNSNQLKLFLPCKVNDEITLLAVWTKKNQSEYFGYIGQFWKYIQLHREELQKEKTVICGDFNSNTIWDKKDSWWNHTDVVNELEQIGITSLYHIKNDEQQGNEFKPTFYLQRNQNKSYHIDYAFLSSDLIKKSNIKIGEKKDWLEYSDHMPLIVTINSL